MVTPVQSRFHRADKTIEVRPQLDRRLPSRLNLRHLLAFSVLAALASPSFQRRSAFTAWLVVLVLSATFELELEQLYFAGGHCPIRDLLPNIVAATLGVSIAHGIRVVPQCREQH